MFSRKRHPIICLLEIPVEAIAYVIMIGLGAQVDQLLFGASEANADARIFPFFFVTVFVITTILFIITVVFSIVSFVRYTIQKVRKKKKNAIEPAASKGEEELS